MAFADDDEVEFVDEVVFPKTMRFPKTRSVREGPGGTDRKHGRGRRDHQDSPRRGSGVVGRAGAGAGAMLLLLLLLLLLSRD